MTMFDEERTTPDLEEEVLVPVVPPKKEQVTLPEIGSQEWEEYVLSLFTEDELVDGYPKCQGLRRVGELLLGEVVESGIKSIFPPSQSNGMTSTVVYELVIAWSYKVEPYVIDRYGNVGDLPRKIFSDVADCSESNTPKPFSKHPSATASTKAEARTWRKALKLKTVSADELSTEEREQEPISSNQRAFINNKCGQLNISVEKLMAHKGLKNLDNLSKEKATELVQLINDYQNSKVEIPTEVKL